VLHDCRAGEPQERELVRGADRGRRRDGGRGRRAPTGERAQPAQAAREGPHAHRVERVEQVHQLGAAVSLGQAWVARRVRGEPPVEPRGHAAPAVAPQHRPGDGLVQRLAGGRRRRERGEPAARQARGDSVVGAAEEAAQRRRHRGAQRAVGEVERHPQRPRRAMPLGRAPEGLGIERLARDGQVHVHQPRQPDVRVAVRGEVQREVQQGVLRA
jgi:hypothetical protein